MQVDPIKPTLEEPGTMRLNLNHGKLLSNFAFKSNLRHYSVVRPYAFDFVCHVKQRMAGRTVVDMFAHEFPARPLAYYQVGRCRLTVSTPVLKARLVSALEAKMSRTAFKGCFQFQLAPLQPGGARTRAAAGPTHAQLPADAGQGGERGTCSWEGGGRKGTGTGDGEWRKGRKGRKWRNGGVWKRGGRRQQ